MNTLTIPTPGLSAGNEVVLDRDVITYVKQSSETKTVIYTSKTTEGQVSITHASDPNGSMGNAINHALLVANSGNAMVVNPAISITNVTYA
jgi:hypothetical protein|tara:strand:- start:207 stop:479 length:273 start_codon:yes stop_codon:yes gene_type:complete